MNPCELQLNYLNDSEFRKFDWAMDFADFSSKPETKYLHRTFGHYDECLSFNYDTESRRIGTIRGKYCTIISRSLSDDLPDIELPEWSGKFLEPSHEEIFKGGICVPDTCSNSDLKRFIAPTLRRAAGHSTHFLCQTDKAYSLCVLDYVILVALALLLTAIIASTIYDILKRKQPVPAEVKNCYTALSLYTNVKELLQIDYSKSHNVIYCMNGLRVLSAFWVIASHRLQRRDLYMSIWDKPTNVIGIIILEIIYKVGYAVDVFFLLSSILVTYSCLRAFEKKKMNLAKFYISRYLRYAPSMMILVLFVTSSFPMLLIDGPVIRYFYDVAWKCQRYWWSSLLLIQTYTNVNNICLGHTWYLNTDFQLYLVSPFFIYIAWKLGFKSFWIFGAILAFDQVYIFFMTYLLFEDYNLREPCKVIAYRIVYRHMHLRLGQWLIGVALGYFMYRFKNDTSDIKISKKVQRICWIVTLSALITQEICYFTVKDKFYEEFFHATFRIVFTCFIGWMIFSFHYLKSGSVIRWFLSHPLWQPLSKLSLSIYLVHDVYIIMSVSNTKELSHYEMSWFVHVLAGDVLMSILYGALLYLLFEAPIAKLVNYYIK